MPDQLLLFTGVVFGGGNTPDLTASGVTPDLTLYIYISQLARLKGQTDEKLNCDGRIFIYP